MTFRTRHSANPGNASFKGSHSQSGMALVFVLVMMSIVMAIVVISARLATQSQRSAINERDRQIAFQAAEAALNDAELDIMDPTTTRGCMFGTSAVTADAGCSSSSTLRGVCGVKSTNPIYQDVDWTNTSSSRQYVNYGEFTGRAAYFQVGAAGAPAVLPKYIILKTNVPVRVLFDNNTRSLNTTDAFKVYALGYGASQETQVLLESTIIKPVLSNQCTTSSGI